MLKNTAAIAILALSLTATADPADKPINPADFSLEQINQAATKDAQDKKSSTRSGLEDMLHNRCLRSSLDENTPVEKAQRSCRDFMAAMTKPRKLSVLDFLWLQGTFETITSKTATKDEKEAANHGLVNFIKNNR